MKHSILAAALVSLMALQANAQTSADLQGQWKFVKQECLSGAPFTQFGADMSGSVKAKVVIVGNQLRSRFEIYMKYDPAYADNAIRQMEDGLASAQQLPDGPDKQKSIDDLNNALRVVQQYKAGVRCTTSEVDPYSLNGSVFHAGKAISRSSNCPGEDTADDSDSNSMDSVVELTGNVLKLTDAQAETHPDSSCPVGDKTVTTFVRVE